MRKLLSCLLFCTLLGVPAFGQLVEWGLDEYQIVTDVRFDGSLWHYGYEVSAALNGVAVYSFEIATDPLVNPLVAFQAPVLPAGWTANATVGRIRFETAVAPIPPNYSLRFEYASTLNPSVLPATAFNNPPVWFGNAMGPGLAPFNNRPIGVWVNLGASGPWTMRQALITTFTDEPDHKAITTDYVGKVSALGLYPYFQGSQNIVVLTKFHVESSGARNPAGWPAYVYDYLARNTSLVSDNSGPLTSKFSIYTLFAQHPLWPPPDFYISWTAYAGPPNRFPGPPPGMANDNLCYGMNCWPNDHWPDSVLDVNSQRHDHVLAPGSERSERLYSNNAPQWAGINFAINPEFQPTEPFNFSPTPVNYSDPLMIRSTGKPESTTFTGVPASFNKVTITNDKPGLTHLEITVNRRNFEITPLRDNEVRTVDISSAMLPANNTITFTALGKPGGQAQVLLHE